MACQGSRLSPLSFHFSPKSCFTLLQIDSNISEYQLIQAFPDIGNFNYSRFFHSWIHEEAMNYDFYLVDVTKIAART